MMNSDQVDSGVVENAVAFPSIADAHLSPAVREIAAGSTLPQPCKSARSYTLAKSPAHATTTRQVAYSFVGKHLHALLRISESDDKTIGVHMEACSTLRQFGSCSIEVLEIAVGTEGISKR
jgi:hypothetical protein